MECRWRNEKEGVVAGGGSAGERGGWGWNGVGRIILSAFLSPFFVGRWLGMRFILFCFVCCIVVVVFFFFIELFVRLFVLVWLYRTVCVAFVVVGFFFFRFVVVYRSVFVCLCCCFWFSFLCFVLFYATVSLLVWLALLLCSCLFACFFWFVIIELFVSFFVLHCFYRTVCLLVLIVE